MSDEVSSEVSEAEISDSTEAVSEGESTEVEGSEEAIEEQVESSAEETVEEVAPKMFKTIVNGREELVTEEEMVSNYQQRRASAEAFRQASDERKAAQSIKDNMRSNPVQALRDAGMDDEAIKEMFYSQTKNFLDLSEETDDQRQARENQEELDAFRQDRLDREESLKTDNEKAESARYEEEIETEFTSALEQGNIPSSPGAISRIAQIQIMNLDKGYDLTVSEAAQIYEEERREDVNVMFNGMNIDQVMNWIGPERMKEVRLKDLEKIRGPKAKEEAPVLKKAKGDKILASDFFR